ncbi:MAG: hypothetical protein JO246_10645 [Frankiaceae bacterium]|nr:hypothetical protein [Frankiaceae bacterium]MBV9870617.1 hypothetical protein [Frankiaceae bacterium]
MDGHTKAYVCTHVFSGDRPVLLVSRPEGDWCLLCGDEHPDDASAYRVVGIGHFLDADAALSEVVDLVPDQEAERAAPGEPWIRATL